ncbi:MAG: DsbA family protein [Pseudomonadota bacterium]
MTDVSEPTPTAAEEPVHFIYFADPMCSWCYGFSPVIEAVNARFSDRLPIRIVVGGLRAGNTNAMRPEDKDYIRNAWTRVGEATGQPFDFAFFDREGFVYDTEPACRAVVAMRHRHPERALAFKGQISAAFYRDNRDTTDADVLADIAAEFGDDRDAFKADLLNPDIRNETFRDFLFSQQSGVQGFPCLVVGSDTVGFSLVTNGYRPLDGLLEALEGWLEKQAA